MFLHFAKGIEVVLDFMYTIPIVFCGVSGHAIT